MSPPMSERLKLTLGCSMKATFIQGLTLVHFSAQRKHILWDTMGAWFSPNLLDRGTRGGVTKTAEVELKSGGV